MCYLKSLQPINHIGIDYKAMPTGYHLMDASVNWSGSKKQQNN